MPIVSVSTLVIVNARAAAVGDALARLLKSQGYAVTTEFYVNDAGNQFQALAKSFEARVRQALGEDAPLPENGYPGDYLVDLARDYVKEGRPAADMRQRLELVPECRARSAVRRKAARVRIPIRIAVRQEETRW